MYRFPAIAALAATAAMPAQAQSLKQQIVGAWSLTSGSEQTADGSKVKVWSSGELFLDPSGRFAFLVFADRPKAEGVADPRVPVAPMVAYFGTYDLDEGTQTLTYHVSTASTPAFNGMTRGSRVTVVGDILTTVSTPVKTPKGDIIPINEWRREK
jgi:hypothetical protein